ncbi:MULTISPECIES: hypothetical protein [Clostridium]|uniref:hypothetical protein n=1 Tax=Clostridium TaxID=1485 RepID=UPI00069E3772|nr:MULTISPECIES: hypothetical protein [Clostridium]KOF57843.1 hypothetical protein AGR56_16705 [Clostridium sp. DMHC 10]MCD2345072.1 hypothetical protein [Clostridium guangxiense]
MKNVILQNFKGINFYHAKRICIKGNIALFTIYKNPKDFANKYVVRLWEINRQLGNSFATKYCVVKGTLEECRNSLPEGLYKIDRFKSDDPVIVEIWI